MHEDRVLQIRSMEQTKHVQKKSSRDVQKKDQSYRHLVLVITVRSKNNRKECKGIQPALSNGIKPVSN